MRERMRRAAALLCAVVMALALWPVEAWALEEDAAKTPGCSYMFINPLIPHSGEDIALFSAPTDYAVYAANSNFPVFSTVQAAADYARAEVKKREVHSVFMDIPTNWDNIPDDQWTSHCQQISEQILAEVIRHTGDPTDGDYLLLHCYGIGYMAFPQEGICRVILQVIKYLSSAPQDAAAGAEAARILQDLRLDGMSEYEKICAIYDWLCSNVTYDDSEPADETAMLLQHSAYAALVEKTAVCQGYATAFYRLALMAGLDARVVTGYGDGGPHGWNIVRLDGQWYYVDATWDATWNAGVKEKDWRFFLRASLDQHELDELGESVVAQYHISPVDYYRDVGQLNTDGSITVQDMQLLYTFLTTGDVPVGQNVLADGVFQQAADVNRDGQVDVYDLQMLYEIVCQIR